MPKPFNNKIIVDAGHGGFDPGAVNVALSLKEAELTLRYADVLNIMLSVNYRSVMTRNTDTYVSLKDRVALANKYHAGLFVSVHLNSAENPKAKGFEIWTSRGDTVSDMVATSVFHSIGDTFPKLKRREDWSDGDPDKEMNYYVLRATKMPAILIELGFICNDKEAGWLSSPDVIGAYSSAIYHGIKNVWN